MNVKYLLIACLAALSMFALIGCTDSDSTSSGPAGTGEIRMYLVDSPSEYDAVNIVVTRVEVHIAEADSNSGWWVVNDSTATYDLLILANGANAVLGDTLLPAGHYTQIRLYIGDGSNVVVDGITYPLTIPSGQQSGLKLNHQFDIESNTLYELTLDFDAESSIQQTGNGGYMLSPVIRVIANIISGTISGMIDPASARPWVWTVAGLDTCSTYADAWSGYFKLMALPEGIYAVHVEPTDTTRQDTTISGVQVMAEQNTELGTIELIPG
ncbi:MAG: DUF4382 domain-containing protein [Candidatus Zixiibacteriota bacterium]|nr:MAG: DUF4382 domain-containing protein [candidate division Zixibacteria bacterium]